MPTRSFDVVILGGGNAGMGVTVATLAAVPRLLGNMDAEAVMQLHRIGVAIHIGIEVRRIERAGERLRVVYEESGSERTAI
jgi:pyruvate/2-oxoglutarate dehydrogenase complex dihydrolipoamide dehydrogenase (E3) component